MASIIVDIGDYGIDFANADEFVLDGTDGRSISLIDCEPWLLSLPS